MAISLDDLDAQLFKCADIIRDAVDPTDYKEFILPMVSSMTVSDEFEKQYDHRKQISANNQLSESVR